MGGDWLEDDLQDWLGSGRVDDFDDLDALRDRVAEVVLAMCSSDRADPLDMSRASDERAVSDVAADLVARGITEPTETDVADAALRMRSDALELATSLMQRASSCARLADAVRGPREVEVIDGGLGGTE